MTTLIQFPVNHETNATRVSENKAPQITVLPQTKDQPTCKTSISYWKSKVKRREYTHNGKLKSCSTLSVRIQHNGAEKWINLETTDKNKAANLARDLYFDIKTLGWTTIRELGLSVPGVSRRSQSLTIGELLTAYNSASACDKRTITGNCSAFRRFTCDVLGMPRLKRSSKKFEREQWLRRIDEVLVRDLRIDDLEAWRKQNAPGTNPRISLSGRPIESVNSMLRSVNSVLTDSTVLSILSSCGLTLKPIELFSTPKPRYNELVPSQVLLDAAKIELAQSNNEEYKLLLLTLTGGLRRSEADLLLWTAFDWEGGYLNVEPSSFYRLKTLSSEGKVMLQPEVLAYFRERYLAEHGNSDFVLISSRKPKRHLVTYTYYRADKTGKNLIAWLRSKGVVRASPLNESRKAFGNEICRRFGNFEASRALRHSNPYTAYNYYLKGRSDGATDFNL